MLITDEFALFKRHRGVQTLLGAADDDLIVTIANMKVGAYTIAAQPGVPSRLSFTHASSGTADTLGTIVLVGTNELDEAITEIVTPEADSTVYSVYYYKTVTSATGVDWVIDVGAGNDTIKIGVGMVAEIICHGRPITIINETGNIWINPLAVAVADATAIKLSAQRSIDLRVRDSLYLISDANSATFQYIIWEL